MIFVDKHPNFMWSGLSQNQKVENKFSVSLKQMIYLYLLLYQYYHHNVSGNIVTASILQSPSLDMKTSFRHILQVHCKEWFYRPAI